MSSKVEWNPEKHQPIIDSVKKDWLDAALHTDTDESAVRESWKELYSFCGFDEPVVVVLDSPLAVQLAVPLVKSLFSKQDSSQLWSQLDSQLDAKLYSQLSHQLRSQLNSPLDSELRSQLWTQLRSQLNSPLGSQLSSQLNSQLDFQLGSQLRSQLYYQLSSQFSSQLRSQLFSQLDSQLVSQLEAQLDSQLGSQLRSQLYYQLDHHKLKCEPFSYEDIYWYGGYAAFYDAASKIIGKKVRGQEMYFKHLKNSGVMSVTLKGFVFVSKKPQVIHWDVQRRLHAAAGPAVLFRDGYSLYSLHGVRMDKEQHEKLVQQEPTSQEILSVVDVDLRSALIQHWGYDKVFDGLPGKRVIDTYTGFQRGSNREVEYVLYEYEHSEGVTARVVRVEWHEFGTKRASTLGVPPEQESALGAIAWTFGMSEEEYNEQLEVET